MSSIRPSLIVCTHNPRVDFLRRVIEACKGQRDLPNGVDIVIVDSASAPPVAERLPEFHEGRIVRSDAPGLAKARALGIRESTGDPIVFVDDDTVLALDYVAQALRILSVRPYLAAIGGQLLPEYEGPLPLD